MPGLRLAGDRVAGHDGDGDRQEQRQHDRQRRQRVQRPVGQHGRQERRARPGRGAEVGDRQQHGDEHRQRVEDADGRPRPGTAEHLPQLDGDHRRRLHPVGARAGRGQHHLLEGGPLQLQPGHRDPGGDQPRVDLGRVGAADDDPSPVDRGHPAVENARTRSGSGVCTTVAPVGAVQRGQLVLQHQPAAVEDADPRAQLLDLGEQVAGQEDRRPAAVAGRAAARGSRGCPAGPGRWSARRARAAPDGAAARRPGRAAGACRGSRPAPGGGRPRPARPARAPRRSVPPGAPGPPGPAASSSARFARPERWP